MLKIYPKLYIVNGPQKTLLRSVVSAMIAVAIAMHILLNLLLISQFTAFAVFYVVANSGSLNILFTTKKEKYRVTILGENKLFLLSQRIIAPVYILAFCMPMVSYSDMLHSYEYFVQYTIASLLLMSFLPEIWAIAFGKIDCGQLESRSRRAHE